MRSDLLEAREINRLANELKAEMPTPQTVFGFYDANEDTDFDRLESAVATARRVLEITDNHPPDQLKHWLSPRTAVAPQIKIVGARLGAAIQEWEQFLNRVSEVVSLNKLAPDDLPFVESPLGAVATWTTNTLPAFDEFCRVADELLKNRRANNAIDLQTLVEDAARKDNLQTKQLEIDRESERLRRKFGSRFAGLRTTWAEILEAIRWTIEMRRLFGSRPMSALFVESCAKPGDETASINRTAAAFDEFQQLLGKIIERFEPGSLRRSGKPLQALTFEQLAAVFDEMTAQIDELQNWSDFKQLQPRLAAANLTAFVAEAHRLQVRPANLLPTLQKSLWLAWLAATFQADAVLREFRVNAHESLIGEFREIDRKLIKLAAATVIERCESLRPTSTFTLTGDSEITILRREATKKKRHLPVRDLFQRIPNLVMKLKPCLMMSPLSVSQFLPPPDKLRFDLVIFDEASQIFTEDAVGAIYRGAQLIVAGDNKQMPPTDFFRAAETDDEDGESTSDDAAAQTASSADYASVLDEVQTINGIAVQHLRWHYRSRHESLIAFSNNRFYSDKLVTFPAANPDDPALGIEFAFVAEGVYDRGGKRDNKPEAEKVANRVFEHFQRYPKKSLGVVAFSQAQMIAIEDEIERRRASSREFDEFFKEDRLEGFFVKNLENVQGDERDVIIFSVGYGRDQNGKLTMNFGPLNRDGGERRLNVAVTRAREKVVLVSSIKAGDLNLSAAAGAGVLNFHRYLDYAERGTTALSLNAPQGVGEPDSPLETDIISEIRGLGYEVVPQVGCSGYRIDIGVIDPLQPGRFLLGVEADGATYHSAYTARDRDRLRQQILENLGWKIYRIWSPDWIGKRQAEITRLKTALEQARNSFGNSSNISKPTQTDAASSLETTISNGETTNSPQINRRQREIVTLEKPPEAFVYEVCAVDYGAYSYLDFYKYDSLGVRTELLSRIVGVESPIHLELAAKRMIRAWNMERAAHRVLNILRETAAYGGLETVILRDDFLWTPNAAQRAADDLPSLAVRYPDDSNLDSRRDVKFIASEEIQAAMLLILKHALSLEAESLINETRRLFGFNRSGDTIKTRLATELSALQKKKLVQNVDNKIVLAK